MYTVYFHELPPFISFVIDRIDARNYKYFIQATNIYIYTYNYNIWGVQYLWWHSQHLQAGRHVERGGARERDVAEVDGESLAPDSEVADVEYRQFLSNEHFCKYSNSNSNYDILYVNNDGIYVFKTYIWSTMCFYNMFVFCIYSYRACPLELPRNSNWNKIHLGTINYKQYMKFINL